MLWLRKKKKVPRKRVIKLAEFVSVDTVGLDGYELSTVYHSIPPQHLHW